ncbi:MAG: hypothetical protein ACFFDQ_01340 [Candidatus Thorarchaeota archaeon]
MTALELREEYRQAIATPLNISNIDPDSGKQSILFSSDWVRIILIRLFEGSVNTIEVELSIPEKNNSEYMNSENIISTLIAHLHYILRLSTFGYQIEAMGSDILWTATIEVPTEPPLEFFEVLLPPEPQ